MAKAQIHWVGLSASELDFILRYDPDLKPGEDVHKKVAELGRFIDSVQSMIDDGIETF